MSAGLPTESVHSPEKAEKTLQANLALAGGYALHRLADGSYLITRWGLCRALPDLHAVSQFAKQVGAQ